MKSLKRKFIDLALMLVLLLPNISMAEDVPYVLIQNHEKSNLQGIDYLLEFRPEFIEVLTKFTEFFIGKDSPLTLSQENRLLIALLVSYKNKSSYYVDFLLNQEVLKNSKEKNLAIVRDINGAEVDQKFKSLLHIAENIAFSGESVSDKDITQAKESGASELEIHDTVIIASAFSLLNRYVDGLNAPSPPSTNYFNKEDEDFVCPLNNERGSTPYVTLKICPPFVTEENIAKLKGMPYLMRFRPEAAVVLLQLAESLLGPTKSSVLSGQDGELIATVVSSENQCDFCANYHQALAEALLQKNSNNPKLELDLENLDNDQNISKKLKSLLVIARKVARGGHLVTAEEIKIAKEVGASEKEIHDTVLIAATFSFYNRYVDGLNSQSPSIEELRKYTEETKLKDNVSSEIPYWNPMFEMMIRQYTLSLRQVD